MFFPYLCTSLLASSSYRSAASFFVTFSCVWCVLSESRVPVPLHHQIPLLLSYRTEEEEGAPHHRSSIIIITVYTTHPHTSALFLPLVTACDLPPNIVRAISDEASRATLLRFSSPYNPNYKLPQPPPSSTSAPAPKAQQHPPKQRAVPTREAPSSSPVKVTVSLSSSLLIRLSHFFSSFYSLHSLTDTKACLFASTFLYPSYILS